MKRIERIIAVLLIVFALTGCGLKKIEPINYFDVEFSGANGFGKADVLLDADGLFNAIKETMSSEDFSESEINAFIYGTDDACFRYSLDKTDGLKNGDEVTLILEWNNDNLKKYKFQFAGKTEKKFTVEGLPDAEIIDPFDSAFFDVDEDQKGVHFTFEGSSPLLKIQIQNDIDKRDVGSKLVYRFDGDRFYRNGDTIKIEVSSNAISNIDEPFEIDGTLYALKRKEFDYIIKDQTEILTSLDQINDESWQKLKEAFTNVRNDYFRVGASENTWIRINGSPEGIVGHSDEVNNLTFLDAYLVTLRDGYNYEDYYYELKNRLAVTLKFDVVETKYFGAHGSYDDVYGILWLDVPKIDKDGNILFTEDQIKRSDHAYIDFDKIMNEDIVFERYKYESIPLNWD